MICPNCQKDVAISEQLYGALYTCGSCQAVYFINFEGQPEFGEVPAGVLSDIVSEPFEASLEPLVDSVDMLSFDNKLVIVKLKGRDLIADLETPEAGFAGVERTAKGYRLEGGKPLDPGGTYTVATIDFLYYGGSSFQFLKQDPTPKETGLDWRAPLVDWMRRQKTTPATPLERRIDPIGGTTAEVHH